MSIFANKKRPATFADKPQIVPAPVNYESALDYLVGLSDKDYKTLCEVADIYRDADQRASKALGVKNEPTAVLKEKTATAPPIIKNGRISDTLIHDELEAAFAGSEPDEPGKGGD